MPIINGRYYINPVIGKALEAARETEMALLALREETSGDPPNRDATDSDEHSAPSDDSRGPIHRLEIEASQTVPAASGRASHGFVARVHRVCKAGASATEPKPETHVFGNHHDLLNFLRDSLGHE